jgi:hypothetical protein
VAHPRVGGQLDRRFFISLTEGIVIVVVIAAMRSLVLEKPLKVGSRSTRSTGHRHRPGRRRLGM